jgi:hypothetical protein
MLDKLRFGMFAGALLLVGVWYLNPQNPDPSPKPPVGPVEGLVILVDSEPESFPQPPVLAPQKLLEPLNGLFSQYPEDALEFARATKQWAIVVKTDPNLTNLKDFTKSLQLSLESLKDVVPLKGNYSGKIVPATEQVYNYYLPQLKDADGNIASTEIDASVRESLSQYFNALSWKFSEQWLKEEIKRADEGDK